jgi:hypothetical protein
MNKELIGTKMWVSGHFKLYKTDNIQRFLGAFASAELYKKFTKDSTVVLPKTEVIVCDIDKFMTPQGDVFLI